MRFPSLHLFACILTAASAGAQGTPPPVDLPDLREPVHIGSAGTPPIPPGTRLERLSRAVKKEVRKEARQAFNETYPSISTWRPLTVEEKFHVFLVHTYNPRTFLSAAINTAADEITSSNTEYETGFTGACQRYGVELSISETNVFFERFLIPTLLRQDPRYFRNPSLHFWKRTVYAMSRVVITRADNGRNTFNASYIFGGAASQALGDLYVPGQKQGLHPIADRLTFNLARDAGLNLVHEFWPDIRRSVFHR